MSTSEARDDPLDDVPTPAVTALRVVPPGPEVDLVAAERAASHFMRALGLDTTAGAGLERTPRGWRAATPSCSHRGHSI